MYTFQQEVVRNTEPIHFPDSVNFEPKKAFISVKKLAGGVEAST